MAKVKAVRRVGKAIKTIWRYTKKVVANTESGHTDRSGEWREEDRLLEIECDESDRSGQLPNTDPDTDLETEAETD